MFHSLLHNNRLADSDTLENYEICVIFTLYKSSSFTRNVSHYVHDFTMICNIWLPVVVVGACVVVVVVVARTVVSLMRN